MENFLRYKNVDWSMPFLFVNDLYLPILFDLLGENHSIKYAYGAPQCVWSGGRLSNCEIINVKFIEKILKYLVTHKIIPAFTFSNISLKKDDINDKFCNDLLKVISDYNGQIIVVSELLYNHIKENFPNIKLVASVINSTYLKVKDIDETNHINNLLNKYDRVVMRSEYALNNNFDFKNIKDISRIELLINQNCVQNCTNSEIHYKCSELFNRKLITNRNYEKAIKHICDLEKNLVVKTNSLNYEQVQKCIENGITNLKLQGRNFTFDGMLKALFIYYFNENINQIEIINKINDFILNKVKNSTKLQLFSLLES
jgi:hypothetical protein